ncbi:MAG: ABC transporter permease [Actinomycetota bacterium]
MSILRAELLKVLRRPATWVIFSIAVGTLVLLVYLAQYLAAQGSSSGLSTGEAAELKERIYPGRFLDAVLSNMTQVFHVLALVLGALSVGSEYGWGTWKTILSQGPTRTEVMLGKLVMVAVVVTSLTLTLFALAAASSYVLATVDGAHALWPPIAEMAQAVGAGVLVMLLWAMLGASLAALLRQSAVALGLGITYVLTELIASSILSSLEGARAFLRVLPGVNAAAFLRANLTTEAPPFMEISGSRAGFVVTVYACVLILLSTLLVRQRDVA